jgi:hypothetical protein
MSTYNPFGYEPGWTIEQHRDELIGRLGEAIRQNQSLQQQVEALQAERNEIAKAKRNMEAEFHAAIYRSKQVPEKTISEEYRDQRIEISALQQQVTRLTAALEAVQDEPNWIRLPNEQAWWWHWNGEDYSVPHIYSVLVSKTGSVRAGFVSYPDSRWCDEIGGWWLKVEYPNVPTREYQARLSSPVTKAEARPEKI